ncbi:hypothetical protein THIOKS1850008 [Thiocapsa sp. KS1]|nr:hypothetical protein THIOKS1850008 [Thiocapsa sp. KS1]
MKPSRYNLTSANPDTGETILFNTLYGSTVAVDRAHWPVVADLLASSTSGDCDSDPQILGALKRGRFIIEDGVDELAIVQNRKTCGMKDTNRADVIIMPNMDCNFACPYCYEKHDRTNRMTPRTESALKVWLGNVIDEHKLVLLNWFGGEPLLSPGTILSIGEFARNRCREKGVSLLAHITTNGYALTPSLISRLIDIEIFGYQITMDCPAHIHDRTRILRSGKGTFGRILDNVITLCEANDQVKIALRVNFNHKNIDAIPDLLAQFPQQIRSQLRVVYEPVFGDAAQSATANLAGAAISSALTRYYELAASIGFDVVLGGLGIGKLAYCYAEREHQYIVNFNGDVFKCSVGDFAGSGRVGFIDAEGVFVRDQDKWDDWFSMDLFEEHCKDCSFLPLCMGGCRKDRIENKRTGSYCHLVPTNTSHALKSVAFGSFKEILSREVKISRDCAKARQTVD